MVTVTDRWHTVTVCHNHGVLFFCNSLPIITLFSTSILLGCHYIFIASTTVFLVPKKKAILRLEIVHNYFFYHLLKSGCEFYSDILFNSYFFTFWGKFLPHMQTHSYLNSPRQRAYILLCTWIYMGTQKHPKCQTWC